MTERAMWLEEGNMTVKTEQEAKEQILNILDVH